MGPMSARSGPFLFSAILRIRIRTIACLTLLALSGFSPCPVPSGSSLLIRIRIRSGYHGSFNISGIPTDSRVAGLIWTSPANPAASSHAYPRPASTPRIPSLASNQQTKCPSPFQVLSISGDSVDRIKYRAGEFVIPSLPPSLPPHPHALSTTVSCAVDNPWWCFFVATASSSSSPVSLSPRRYALGVSATPLVASSRSTDSTCTANSHLSPPPARPLEFAATLMLSATSQVHPVVLGPRNATWEYVERQLSRNMGHPFLTGCL
ncbi:hypothetical protein CCMSSC00406_0009959 [Pleurotus cornucopiae]|uniref:Uncharacterized protein n=1 Tax=Pleurotus cornucopiae TaxID=5321 RepID=A0ACB7J5A0_PLECO|nr:hypothetical protein CCMSSC00406_0009959 [Pleurotus cornucopiae]